METHSEPQRTLFANQELAMAELRQMLLRGIDAIDAGKVPDVIEVGLFCAMLQDCTLSLAVDCDRDQAASEFYTGSNPSNGDLDPDDAFVAFMAPPGEQRREYLSRLRRDHAPKPRKA